MRQQNRETDSLKKDIDLLKENFGSPLVGGKSL